MIERKYPVNYWISMYMIPCLEALEPFFVCIENDDFVGAGKVIDSCDTDELHKALMKSLLYQSVGDVNAALKVLEPFADAEDFYINRNLLRLYLSLSMTDNADKALKSLKPANEEMQTIVLNAEGSLMWRSGRNEMAKERFEQAFELAQKCNNNVLTSSCLINRALILQCFGSTAEAEELYNDAMDMAKGSGNVENAMISMLDLGELYKEMGKKDRAKEILLSAIDYSRGYKSYSISSIRRDCYVNLGDISLLEKNYDTAEEFYEKAINEELGEIVDAARAYIGKTQICIERRKLSDALDLLETAYNLARQAGSTRYEAESLLLRGMINEKQNRLNEALQNYGVAMFLFRKLGNTYEIAKAERAVGEIYRKMGDDDRAAEHMKKAEDTSASMTGTRE